VLYERDRLDIGATINGPAIVEQFDATAVIPAPLERNGRCLPQPDPAEGVMDTRCNQQRRPECSRGRRRCIKQTE